MFAVFAAAFCLVSLSHSAPLSCEDFRPLDHVDRHHLKGAWSLVAGTNSATADVLKKRDSTAIYLYNSSCTHVNRVGDTCKYHYRNISMEGSVLKMKFKTFNYTGTFYHTSCTDCMAFKLAVVSPNFETVDFLLFSRRREVEQEVMEEFRAQVQCLNMPPPIIMDPTKELCPEQTDSEPAAAAEEKTEEHKA